MKNLLLILCCLTGYTLLGQTLAFEDQNASFDSPVDVTGAGDDSERLFIVERAGRIKIFDRSTSTTLAGNFLDISSIVLSGGEQGLLGLAFHPDYANNGYFYVNYTSQAIGDRDAGTTTISRFRNDVPAENSVNSATEQILLTVDQFASNHNAGDLAFGPDGFLYIPLGDGGGGGDPQDNGQDLSTFLGKMLRIDVDNPSGGNNYGIPPDNPFVSDGTVSDEIYAFGLRNPWRISFDRDLGDLWIADVGQSAREEVNFQAAGTAGGQNYGWDCREGFIAYSGSSSSLCVAGSTYTDPVFDYPRNSTTGGFSITGGFVYRGTNAADLVGKYICVDYASNNFFLFDAPPTVPVNASIQSVAGVTSISSFGEADNGDLFVVSLNGPLFEVTSELALPVSLTNWTATRQDKAVLLEWTTAQELSAKSFDLERGTDGSSFTVIGTVEASGTAEEETSYTFLDENPLPGVSYYRLVQRDLDNTTSVYSVKSVIFATTDEIGVLLSPNPTSGIFTLRTSVADPDDEIAVRVFANDGRLVLRKDIRLSGASGYEFDLSDQPAGTYSVRLITAKGTVTKSVIKK